jgi:uncharacterized caspase-like protein
MKKFALLVGVSSYENGLEQLPKAVKDAEALRAALEDPETGGFQPENVKLLINPNRNELEVAAFSLFSSSGKDDLVLFYFSGHGIKDEYGSLFFATRETKKNDGLLIPPTASSASTLQNSMTRSKSQRQVVILDCCFSGAFAKGLTSKDSGSVDIKAQLGGQGRAVLTSSTSTQYSFEADDSDLSVYTRFIVEGIEKGAADLDGDGQISVDELHEYAYSRVHEAAPAMNPEFYPFKEGHKIFIAKTRTDDPKLIYRKK